MFHEFNTSSNTCDWTLEYLEPKTKQLIQNAIDRMNYTNTNRSLKEEIVHNLDTIIGSLQYLRQDVIRLT